MGAAENLPIQEVGAGVFDWYEDDVKEAEARPAVPPAQGSVAFYGSSSIRLWSTLSEDFAGTPVVNLGFGGSTLAACAYFFDRLVVPLAPRSLIFYAGDNDLGDGQTASSVTGSLKDLLEKVDAHFPEIPFGFISIKPSPERWPLIDRIRTVNSDAQAILANRPRGVYLDTFTPMLSDKGCARPELFQADGLHMNQSGYRIWWQVVSARRKDLLL